MRVEIASYCHKGGRDEQQDAFGVFPGRDEDQQLIVVADGMGGHAGGRIASNELVATAKRIWDEHAARPLEPRALLERIIHEGHAAINKAGVAIGLTPRSTAAILYRKNARVHWAHVGDSRIYRFRNGELTARTRDHSIVQMLVDLGKVSEEEMGTHPDQNRLTQSLGGDVTPNPDFGIDDVRPGDGFLVCSDGLWEMTPAREMADALAQPTLDESLARAMVERAFERAGPRSDNITLALMRIGGPPTRLPAPQLEIGALGRAPVSAGAPRARWALAAAFLVALGLAAYFLKPWERGDAGTAPANRSGATTTPPTPVTPTPTPSIGKPPEPAPPEPPKNEGRAPPPEGPKTATPQQEPGTKTEAEPPKSEPPKVEAPRAEPPKAEPPKAETAPENQPRRGAPSQSPSPERK
jgi:serine/threonine protein phosphatase PrpC